MSITHETVLFLDTSQSWLDIVLSRGSMHWHRHLGEARRAFQDLHILIKELLTEADIQKPDVIGAARGPGSFTGVRIGVSTARNLAQLWQIPVFGIDSLALPAWQYWHQANKQHLDWPSGGVWVAVDARQNKVYARHFATPESLLAQAAQPKILDVELTALTEMHMRSGLLLLEGSQQKGIAHSPPGIEIQAWPAHSAEALNACARELSRIAPSGHWSQLSPIYVRPDPANAHNPAGFQHQ
ncbi:MAG: tRNA (adenosine(37)-N6)-threonylcarbamoyltransferase complex dimerization subunit type 1 TsaB [Leptospiraceae bacterium]|nr:tRNA (adenosine(37)-N6)-threonylcarbamoyltransferase complex dimerization subunit type 1 TsaB [Leptospiraceae bacterium]